MKEGYSYLITALPKNRRLQCIHLYLKSSEEFLISLPETVIRKVTDKHDLLQISFS